MTVTFREVGDSIIPSATAGEDFTAGATVVRFEQGQRSANIPLPILNDLSPEASEVMGVSFPQYSDGSGEIEGRVIIRDNDFNLLHPTPICLNETGTLFNFLPVAENKVVLVFQTAFAPNQFRVVRMSADGSIDPAFAPIIQSENPTLHAGPGNSIALVSFLGDGERIELLSANGARDTTFAPFSAPRFGKVVPAGDSLFVVEGFLPSRVIKLRRDGTRDAAFDMPAIDGEIVALARSADGGVLISTLSPFQFNGATRQFARITATGELDETFNPAEPVINYQILNGAVYGTAGNRVVRVLPNGQLDPQFSSFAAEAFTTLVSDSAGRLIAARWRFSGEFLVDRFLADGTRDATYPGGIFTAGAAAPEFTLLSDESLLALGALGQVNGAALTCEGSAAVMARFNLTAPNGNFQIDPSTTQFAEGAVSPRMQVFRLGNNEAAAGPVRYRLRAGTAGAADVSLAEGELHFSAGVSRAFISLNIADDQLVERGENFFVEFLSEEGAPLGSSEIRLTSNDIGLRLVRQVSGNLWEIAAEGYTGGNYALESTDGFASWRRVFGVSGETPFQVRFDQSRQYFRLRRED